MIVYFPTKLLVIDLIHRAIELLKSYTKQKLLTEYLQINYLRQLDKVGEEQFVSLALILCMNKFFPPNKGNFFIYMLKVGSIKL